jgi:NAD(P)-dependent dehydrogenase (short-subunit alcohol dehydrogenase family)
MTHNKVWFVTGAGRGMGADITNAVTAAGHAVVATGRNPDAVSRAINSTDQTLVLKLDVTRPDDAQTAVDAATKRFGRIDVLVNNAGNFYAGFFEEVPPEDFRSQIETNFFGPVNLTRAVLPIMRAQRSGLVVNISSIAGIVGDPFTSAYVSAKFALEGWTESLANEVAPFGIRTMLVVPGFFRTELLTDDSTKWPTPAIADYAAKTRETIAAWRTMSGRQTGDPAKLAAALVALASQPEPPLRWPAGADAVAALERKAELLLAQANAHRALSSSLALYSA